jgi:NADPH:quinone reductase-like Zn-dependent oxidoreductase
VRAAVRDRYGPPTVVDVRDIERPDPVDDQVLVRVHTASVNRADLDALYPRWQLTRLFLGLRKPRSSRLGLDAAGVIDAVGPNAHRFNPGDRVFGDMYLFGGGAFAEYVCVPERAFLPIPPEMAFDVAATLPHSGVLAVQALRAGDRIVGPGDRVLIVGASGNVGPFAVQIAKARGADVTGVCRTDKIEFVRSLGADRVIDYTTTDYTRGARYDWIVDVDAHQPILRWRGALRPKAVYAALGGPGSWIPQALVVGPAMSLARGARTGLLLSWKPFNPPDVASLEELIATAQVRAAIDRRFALDDIVPALQHVDEGRARGKVLVTIS